MDTQQATNTQPQPQLQPPAGAPTIIMQTSVEYSVGLLSRPQKGTLIYDSTGLVQLVDIATNTLVFSSPMQAILKVSRAEYALYMSVPGVGKKVAIMFGKALRYVGENAAMAPFGVPGAVGGLVRSNKMNEQSGLEAWVTLFKENGKITNISPNKVAIIAVVVVLVVVAIAMIAFAL